MSNTKPYLQRNLALAWPLAVNALLVQSMLMIDTVLVAPLGELPIAAMGLASAIVSIALGVGLAVANGLQLLVARASGSNSKSNLVVGFWVGLSINTTTALVFFAILAWLSPAIVGVMTHDASLASKVLSYLSIIKYIILFSAFTHVCTAFYNGCGNTQLALKGLLIEVPANVILSYTLIYGVELFDGFGFNGLGFQGAAWGSLLAIVLRAVYFLIILTADKDLSFKYPAERPFFVELRSAMVEILPIAVNFMVLFVGAAVYQLLFSQLELASFVAITLVFPWLMIGTQLVAAWAQASAIMISQALGKNESQHLSAFIGASVRSAVALSVGVAALFFLLSQSLHFIYPGLAPETSLALTLITPLIVLWPIVRGYNSISGKVLRALGESSRVLKLNIVTQWMIALPVCALLILIFDASVFWAFVILPIEEILKLYHFRKYTRDKLNALSGVVRV